MKSGKDSAIKGITQHKIRAVKKDVYRTARILEEAARRGIKIGIGMCQNRADPPHAAVDDVTHYIQGEIITTPKERITRIRDGVYAAVQRDASVIRGISAVMGIFAAARTTSTRDGVHAWGSRRHDGELSRGIRSRRRPP